MLKLETMYFADEIRSPGSELPDLPDAVDLSDREVSMAQLLLESMESEWDPNRYHDTHRKKVEALVEEKRQGNEVVANVAEAPSATTVVDLMDVLTASIDSVKSRRATDDGAPSGKRRPSAGPTAVKKVARPVNGRGQEGEPQSACSPKGILTSAEPGPGRR